jgi:hypothetical protein
MAECELRIIASTLWTIRASEGVFQTTNLEVFLAIPVRSLPPTVPAGVARPAGVLERDRRHDPQQARASRSSIGRRLVQPVEGHMHRTTVRATWLLVFTDTFHVKCGGALLIRKARDCRGVFFADPRVSQHRGRSTRASPCGSCFHPPGGIRCQPNRGHFWPAARPACSGTVAASPIPVAALRLHDPVRQFDVQLARRQLALQPVSRDFGERRRGHPRVSPTRRQSPGVLLRQTPTFFSRMDGGHAACNMPATVLPVRGTRYPPGTPVSQRASLR